MRVKQWKLYLILVFVLQLGAWQCTKTDEGTTEEDGGTTADDDSSASGSAGAASALYAASKNVSISGSLALTGSSGSASLVSSAEDYYFKCVTTKLTDVTACISAVESEKFELKCGDGFSGAFGCFILSGADDENLAIVGLVTSKDFNMDENSTDAEMAIVFDAETGAAQVQGFNQFAKKVDGSKVEIETEEVEKAVPPALLTALEGKFSSGDYDMTMCFPPPPSYSLTKSQGYDGDGISEKCGNTGGMTKIGYIKYIQGDATENRFPRLELWNSRQDFLKCVPDGSLRYHLSDGTKEFIPTGTTFNALDLVDKIIENKWAPEFALKFYELSQNADMVQDKDKMAKEQDFVTALFEYYGITKSSENMKEMADTLAQEFFKAFDLATTTKVDGKLYCNPENIPFDKVNIPSWLMEDDKDDRPHLVKTEGKDEGGGGGGDDPIKLCGPYRDKKANGATQATLQGMVNEFSMWIVRELGRDPMAREKAEAGLKLVDSFLHAIGESRHQQHSGDNQSKEFREAWNALDQTNLSATTDDVLKTFSFAWADFIQQWDWTFPEQLRLAANNFSGPMFSCETASLVKSQYDDFEDGKFKEDNFYSAPDDFAENTQGDYQNGYYCPPPPPGFTTATTGKEFILAALAESERLKMIQEKLCDNDWNFDFNPVASIIRPFVAENMTFENHNVNWKEKGTSETETIAGKRRLAAVKGVVLSMIQSGKLHGCQLTHLKQDFDRLDRQEFYWDQHMGPGGPKDFIDCSQDFNKTKTECAGTGNDDQFCKYNPMDPKCFDPNSITNDNYDQCQWDLFGTGIQKHDMCMKWAMYGYNDVAEADTFCFGGAASPNYSTPECQFYNHDCHVPANQSNLECACLPGSPFQTPDCFAYECTKNPSLPHCQADFDPTKTETTPALVATQGPGMQDLSGKTKENQNAYQWMMERGWAFIDAYRSAELQYILEQLLAGKFTKPQLINALNKFMKLSGWDHMFWMIEEINKRGVDVAARFLTEEVARESFRTDVTYREKMKQIIANSDCLFDAGISWASREVDEKGNEVFPAVIRAPVKREFAGELEFDKDKGGSDLSDQFRLDTARLNFQDNCYWGEVQRLSSLKFDGTTFEANYDRGFVDTCREGMDNKGGDDSGSAKLVKSQGEDKGEGGGGRIEKLKLYGGKRATE